MLNEQRLSLPLECYTFSFGNRGNIYFGNTKSANILIPIEVLDPFHHYGFSRDRSKQQTTFDKFVNILMRIDIPRTIYSLLIKTTIKLQW